MWFCSCVPYYEWAWAFCTICCAGTGLAKTFIWVFLLRCYGKTGMNVLANSILRIHLSLFCLAVAICLWSFIFPDFSDIFCMVWPSYLFGHIYIHLVLFLWNLRKDQRLICAFNLLVYGKMRLFFLLFSQSILQWVVAVRLPKEMEEREEKREKKLFNLFSLLLLYWNSISWHMCLVPNSISWWHTPFVTQPGGGPAGKLWWALLLSSERDFPVMMGSRIIVYWMLNYFWS